MVVQIKRTFIISFQVLQKRKDLKLILMSATLDADKLCTYFNDCPLFHIEGLAYPVKDIYLEEVLQLTKFRLLEQTQLFPPTRAQKPYHRHMKKYKDLNRDISEKAIQYRAFVGMLNKIILKYSFPYKVFISTNCGKSQNKFPPYNICVLTHYLKRKQYNKLIPCSLYNYLINININ